MSEKFLNRADAPFDAKVWEAIDATVTGSAKSQLAARRLLYVEGPYGLGLKSLPAKDADVKEDLVAQNVKIVAACALPVASIQSGFRLGGRDIAAFEAGGLPLDLGAAAVAAIACARQEDAVIFNGSKGLGTDGLLTAKGAQSFKLKAWDQAGAAVADLIEAVTKLDGAGFHGPYALALAPDRYNLLYRRYPQGDKTEMEHISAIAADGVIKAAAVRGGVLLATGKQYASIALGQDLMAGFVGPDGRDYEFTVSESIALRLLEPAAICVLK